VRVATRITLATAVVVTLTSAVYAYFDLRARTRERMARVEREGASLASALRVSFEAAPLDLGGRVAPDLGRDLSRASGAWKVSVLPRALVEPPGPAAAAAAAEAGATAAQLRRLRTVIEIAKLIVIDRDDDNVAIAVPLRARAGGSTELTVIGSIDVQRPTDFLAGAANEDRQRAILLVALIAAAATIAVAIVASNLTRRIRKLLRGIDDVAKGDLSHVLLSDRDDEIGAITTRFNEMTFSLRESRAETQRQNQDKLALEQRLGQTEKLATIGQLAAEIAHEVGTPLNVIAGRARSTYKKSDNKDAVEKNATIIAEQTARITRIIQRLLDFARRKVGAHPAARLQLDELTATTMELLAGQIAKNKVKAQVVRADALPWVAGDADRLQQVLINLVLNAVQAMPDGGRLEVQTSVVHRTRPGLGDARPAEFVCVRISDTGSGIPDDIRDKVFDPFYTTKEGQGGTGLGLAVVSGIVKEHDGWIEIADPAAAAGGTTFLVFVPAGGDMEIT
jgi:signal transduction histidine kinase